MKYSLFVFFLKKIKLVNYPRKSVSFQELGSPNLRNDV